MKKKFDDNSCIILDSGNIWDKLIYIVGGIDAINDTVESITDEEIHYINYEYSTIKTDSYELDFMIIGEIGQQIIYDATRCGNAANQNLLNGIYSSDCKDIYQN